VLSLVVFGLLCPAVFLAGAWICARFKSVVVDLE
jgi:hypothetical protein